MKLDLEKCRETAYHSMEAVSNELKSGMQEEEARIQLQIHLEKYKETGDWVHASCAEAYLTAFGL